MKTFFRLLALHRPYAGWLLLGLLLSLLTLLANVVLMSISGWFIAAMGLAGLAGISINYFTPAAIIRACAIVRTTGRYAERLITHDATLRLLSGLRVWLYGVLVPLSPTGLDRERSGGLLNRLTADIDALDNFYLCILLPAATAIIASLVFVAWLWFQSPRLAWVEASLLVLAGGLLPWLLSRAGGRASQHSREIQEQLRIDAVDALQGLGELILYGADETQAAKLSQHSQALGRAQIKSERWTSAAQAIITACAWIALWAMVVLVSPQVESGARPPAELALFALFALASFEAVVPMPLAFRSLRPTLAAARQLFELADRHPPVPHTEPPAPEVSGYSYRFENLGFSYPGSQSPAVADISFTIPEGRCTAIVGPSGSGKSTLLQLMLRFRLPTQGQLQFSDTDIKNWPGDALRQHLAVADQDSHLFIGTLRQNLLLGAPQASEDQLWQACDTAQLTDWIHSLKDGLDTEIGEASLRISGGEARRLAIARALMRNAPILILDEPTEGLDPPTAQCLMKGILAKYRHRTLVIVTHQLNELPLMDQVALLDNGRMMACGPHQELRERSEAYRTLLALAPIAIHG